MTPRNVLSAADLDKPAAWTRVRRLMPSSVLTCPCATRASSMGPSTASSRPGHLIHGDRHGFHTIPRDIAHEIPVVAAGLVGEERALIDFMSLAGFFAVGAGSQAAEEE